MAANSNWANQIPTWMTQMPPGDDYLTSTTDMHGNTIFRVAAAAISNSAVGIRGGHAGWVHVRKGTGPVTGFTVTAKGSYYANGSTVTVSNGTSNATGVVTANSSGNVLSIAVSTGGAGWGNSAQAAVTFDGQKRLAHVGPITLGAHGSKVYTNTDLVQLGNGTVNAVASITTNAAGNIASFTVTSYGLWANTKANSHVAITITDSTGNAAAVTARSGTATALTANLEAGSGATATVTIGGRGNRIFIETLDAHGSAVANSTGDTQWTPLAP